MADRISDDGPIFELRYRLKRAAAAASIVRITYI
jgi:hypothetical protein